MPSGGARMVIGSQVVLSFFPPFPLEWFDQGEEQGEKVGLATSGMACSCRANLPVFFFKPCHTLFSSTLPHIFSGLPLIFY